MNEQLERIIKHPVTIPVAASTTTLIIGLASGYFIGRRNGRNHMIDIIDSYESSTGPSDVAADDKVGLEIDAEELPKLKKRWETLPHIDPDEPPPPITIVPAGVFGPPSSDGVVVEEVEVCEIEPETEVEPDAPTPPAVITNVFGAGIEGWDYDAEVADREGKEIFVLHKDEFYADEEGFTKDSVTYYTLDDIMCDEQNRTLYNYKGTVGELRWGHGSGDNDIFYVRNVKLETDYEVLRLERSYTVEVLGMDAEETERTPLPTRRFREGDDD